MSNVGSHACSAWDALLDAMADGALVGEERERLEAHLAGCERCRRELEGLQKIQQWLEDASQMPVPSPSIPILNAELMRRLEKRRWPSFFPRWWVWAPAVAASLVLLFTTNHFNAPSPGPRPPSPPEHSRGRGEGEEVKLASHVIPPVKSPVLREREARLVESHRVGSGPNPGIITLSHSTVFKGALRGVGGRVDQPVPSLWLVNSPSEFMRSLSATVDAVVLVSLGGIEDDGAMFRVDEVMRGDLGLKGMLVRIPRSPPPAKNRLLVPLSLRVFGWPLALRDPRKSTPLILYLERLADGGYAPARFPYAEPYLVVPEVGAGVVNYLRAVTSMMNSGRLAPDQEYALLRDETLRSLFTEDSEKGGGFLFHEVNMLMSGRNTSGVGLEKDEVMKSKLKEMVGISDAPAWKRNQAFEAVSSYLHPERAEDWAWVSALSHDPDPALQARATRTLESEFWKLRAPVALTKPLVLDHPVLFRVARLGNNFVPLDLTPGNAMKSEFVGIVAEQGVAGMDRRRMRRYVVEEVLIGESALVGFAIDIVFDPNIDGLYLTEAKSSRCPLGHEAPHLMIFLSKSADGSYKFAPYSPNSLDVTELGEVGLEYWRRTLTIWTREHDPEKRNEVIRKETVRFLRQPIEALTPRGLKFVREAAWLPIREKADTGFAELKAVFLTLAENHRAPPWLRTEAMELIETCYSTHRSTDKDWQGPTIAFLSSFLDDPDPTVRYEALRRLSRGPLVQETSPKLVARVVEDLSGFLLSPPPGVITHDIQSALHNLRTARAQLMGPSGLTLAIVSGGGGNIKSAFERRAVEPLQRVRESETVILGTIIEKQKKGHREETTLVNITQIYKGNLTGLSLRFIENPMETGRELRTVQIGQEVLLFLNSRFDEEGNLAWRVEEAKGLGQDKDQVLNRYALFMAQSTFPALEQEFEAAWSTQDRSAVGQLLVGFSSLRDPRAVPLFRQCLADTSIFTNDDKLAMMPQSLYHWHGPETTEFWLRLWDMAKESSNTWHRKALLNVLGHMERPDERMLAALALFQPMNDEERVMMESVKKILPLRIEKRVTALVEEGLGVTVVSLNAQERQSLKVESGVRVTRVAEKSLATASGLQVGDALLKVERTVIKDAKSLGAALMEFSPGSRVKFEIVRNSQPKLLWVVLPPTH